MSRIDHTTWELRRWLLIASALIVILPLAACGGGKDAAEEIAGPPVAEPAPAPGGNWDCWMPQAPCPPENAASTARLIEPPRDTRNL
jgi:hypothetical protein